ncbi:MAG: hypothetical protein ACRDK7_14685 [Solirubrobacteraceae bacterium]
MSTKGITPNLANSLRSLAESQLQTQATRSASVDAGALGVVSACAAIAALILSARSTRHLWIAALGLLGMSAGLAICALLVRGARKGGPFVGSMLDARTTNDDEIIEQGLLKDLATETAANNRALAHKDPLLATAVTLLLIAILLELVGVQ